MAPRKAVAAKSTRAPLQDASGSVLNTAAQKKQPRPQADKLDFNPLRAHPPAVRVHRPTPNGSVTSGRSSDQPNVYVDSRDASLLDHDIDEDKRHSHISTSSASSSKRKTHIGPWHLGKTLGKGAAGRVRLARHRVTQQPVAVKIISKNACHMTQAGSIAELDKWDRKRGENKTDNQMPFSIEREVAILKLIEHPNIVRLYDIWENRAEIYLVLEYVERGDLFEFINQRGPLPEMEAMYYFRQIMSAVEYCHSFNICHRDLKPENILIKDDGQIKVADFGMAAIQQSPSHMLQTACGSPHYAAPELVGRGRYRGDKVDVWSMGIILYAMITCRLPFDDPDHIRLMSMAKNGIYDEPHWLSSNARDMIRKMITVDPDQRISIRKMWKHPLAMKYDQFDALNQNGGQPPEVRKNAQYNSVAPEELDLQTLRHLKSMWHTFSEPGLAEKLTSPEPNDQKLFYWLLFNYRERLLENYDNQLTHSASDFHHLRPANWKKKYTTLQFPPLSGRTPSKFTVISTVATDASDEAPDAVSEEGATVQSYDPYKASINFNNDAASHAHIVVHRNRSSARESTRGGSKRNSSLKTSSTPSRRPRAIRVTASNATQRRSLSSIRSGEGPFRRPASRTKRGVDFSHARNRSFEPKAGSNYSATANASRDDVTSDRPRASMTSPCSGRVVSPLSKEDHSSNSGTGPDSQKEAPFWTEELSYLSHSIAKDCDDAFSSSLLSSSQHGGTPGDTATAESSMWSVSVGTPTPVPQSNRDKRSGFVHLENRPLPPAPEPTESELQEILLAQERTKALRDATKQAAAPTQGIALQTLAPTHDTERRTVSAPIYSQFNTQGGKDVSPLPSINEAPKDEPAADHDKPRTVSAPTDSSTPRLDFDMNYKPLRHLRKNENTIRMVESPSADVTKNVSKATREPNIPPRGIRSSHGAQKEANLRRQYRRGEEKVPAAEPSIQSEGSSSVTIRKKPSWFKRGSGSKEEGGSTTVTAEEAAVAEVGSTDGHIKEPTKKKSFSLAFWRQSKQKEPEAQMSLAEPEVASSPSTELARLFNSSERPRQKEKMIETKAPRTIEPQQNWLARLFRVKPATRHLCFSMSRRRARQEIAILLREWRKYGIRDVQVDKERNLVFARIGPQNHLNMKAVSFAAEVMTVIEHGKRNQLSIVRFTQEHGAASSFHSVVDTMNAVFDVRNLLVADKRKAKMMVKTLNS